MLSVVEDGLARRRGRDGFSRSTRTQPALRLEVSCDPAGLLADHYFWLEPR
jgi:hypothetical protein